MDRRAVGDWPGKLVASRTTIPPLKCSDRLPFGKGTALPYLPGLSLYLQNPSYWHMVGVSSISCWVCFSLSGSLQHVDISLLSEPLLYRNWGNMWLELATKAPWLAPLSAKPQILLRGRMAALTERSSLHYEKHNAFMGAHSWSN